MAENLPSNVMTVFQRCINFMFEVAVLHLKLENLDCTSVVHSNVPISELCCNSCQSVELQCVDYDSYVSRFYDSCEEAVSDYYSTEKTCADPLGDSTLEQVCCESCQSPCQDMDLARFGYDSCEEVNKLSICFPIQLTVVA